MIAPGVRARKHTGHRACRCRSVRCAPAPSVTRTPRAGERGARPATHDSSSRWAASARPARWPVTRASRCDCVSAGSERPFTIATVAPANPDRPRQRGNAPAAMADAPPDSAAGAGDGTALVAASARRQVLPDRPAPTRRESSMRGRSDLCQLEHLGVARIPHILSNPGEICGAARPIGSLEIHKPIEPEAGHLSPTCRDNAAPPGGRRPTRASGWYAPAGR